jgi:hypothetical protein
MRTAQTDVMTFHIDLVRSSLVAECSCGWRSECMSTAGMAGSEWDRHAEVEHGKRH